MSFVISRVNFRNARTKIAKTTTNRTKTVTPRKSERSIFELASRSSDCLFILEPVSPSSPRHARVGRGHPLLSYAEPRRGWPDKLGHDERELRERETARS